MPFLKFLLILLARYKTIIMFVWLRNNLKMENVWTRLGVIVVHTIKYFFFMVWACYKKYALALILKLF